MRGKKKPQALNNKKLQQKATPKIQRKKLNKLQQENAQDEDPQIVEDLDMEQEQQTNMDIQAIEDQEVQGLNNHNSDQEKVDDKENSISQQQALEQQENEPLEAQKIVVQNQDQNLEGENLAVVAYPQDTNIGIQATVGLNQQTDTQADAQKQIENLQENLSILLKQEEQHEAKEVQLREDLNNTITSNSQTILQPQNNAITQDLTENRAEPIQNIDENIQKDALQDQQNMREQIHEIQGSLEELNKEQSNNLVIPEDQQDGLLEQQNMQKQASEVQDLQEKSKQQQNEEQTIPEAQVKVDSAKQETIAVPANVEATTEQDSKPSVQNITESKVTVEDPSIQEGNDLMIGTEQDQIIEDQQAPQKNSQYQQEQQNKFQLQEPLQDKNIQTWQNGIQQGVKGDVDMVDELQSDKQQVLLDTEKGAITNAQKEQYETEYQELDYEDSQKEIELYDNDPQENLDYGFDGDNEVAEQENQDKMEVGNTDKEIKVDKDTQEKGTKSDKRKDDRPRTDKDRDRRKEEHSKMKDKDKDSNKNKESSRHRESDRRKHESSHRRPSDRNQQSSRDPNKKKEPDSKENKTKEDLSRRNRDRRRDKPREKKPEENGKGNENSRAKIDDKVVQEKNEKQSDKQNESKMPAEGPQKAEPSHQKQSHRESQRHRQSEHGRRSSAKNEGEKKEDKGSEKDSGVGKTLREKKEDPKEDGGKQKTGVEGATQEKAKDNKSGEKSQRHTSQPSSRHLSEKETHHTERRHGDKHHASDRRQDSKSHPSTSRHGSRRPNEGQKDKERHRSGSKREDVARKRPRSITRERLPPVKLSTGPDVRRPSTTSNRGPSVPVRVNPRGEPRGGFPIMSGGYDYDTYDDPYQRPYEDPYEEPYEPPYDSHYDQRAPYDSHYDPRDSPGYGRHIPRGGPSMGRGRGPSGGRGLPTGRGLPIREPGSPGYGTGAREYPPYRNVVRGGPIVREPTPGRFGPGPYERGGGPPGFAGREYRGGRAMPGRSPVAGERVLGRGRGERPPFREPRDPYFDGPRGGRGPAPARGRGPYDGPPQSRYRDEEDAAYRSGPPRSYYEEDKYHESPRARYRGRSPPRYSERGEAGYGRGYSEAPRVTERDYKYGDPYNPRDRGSPRGGPQSRDYYGRQGDRAEERVPQSGSARDSTYYEPRSAAPPHSTGNEDVYSNRQYNDQYQGATVSSQQVASGKYSSQTPQTGGQSQTPYMGSSRGQQPQDNSNKYYLASMAPLNEKEKVWYYMDPHHNSQGPCNIVEFRLWIQNLSKQDEYRSDYQQFIEALVWKQGMDRKVPLYLVIQVADEFH